MKRHVSASTWLVLAVDAGPVVVELDCALGQQEFDGFGTNSALLQALAGMR